MIRNYNRQDLKFMKEWKCVSKSFARINLLIIIATAIAFMFCFYCELIPEDEILIYSIFTVILIIECVISYIKQRKLIKYVRFTAEAIYVEKKTKLILNICNPYLSLKSFMYVNITILVLLNSE